MCITCTQCHTTIYYIIKVRGLTVNPSISSWGSSDLRHSAKWLSGPYTSLSSSTTRLLKKFESRSLLLSSTLVPLWNYRTHNKNRVNFKKHVLMDFFTCMQKLYHFKVLAILPLTPYTIYAIYLIKKPAFNLQLPLGNTFTLLFKMKHGFLTL